MIIKELNDTQKTLLNILSASFKKEKYQLTKDADLKGIYEESKAQAVVLQVLNSVDTTKTTQNTFAEKWFSLSINYLKNNLAIHSNHNYLHRLMSENNIDYCVLKGSASAVYYPDPVMRTMGDVDFLVHTKDFEKATEILKNEGFAPLNSDTHICHIALKKDKMHFEVHFAPAGMPEGNAGVLIKSYLEDIFETAQLTEISGNQFMKPCDFHHGLIILMHIYHHMLSEGIGLRHLCDWAAFVNSLENDEFEKLFKEKLTACGLWKFAQILSFLSHKYLNIEYKPFMEKADNELCSELILDIFKGGNFGNKDKNRIFEGTAISSRGKNGIKKSKLLQIISNMNSAALTQFAFLRKCQFLKPIGFIFIGTRFTFRIITGKRKMPDISKSFENAEQRKQIYKQLHLFETEE